VSEFIPTMLGDLKPLRS